MNKIIYIFGIFVLNITYATENFGKNEPLFSLEWIGLILLSFIGFIFILRSAKQIKKIKKLQEELNTYHATLSDTLDTMGENNV